VTTIRYQRMTIPLALGWKDETQMAIVKPRDQFNSNMVISRDTLREREHFEEFKNRALAALQTALAGMTIDDAGPASFGPWHGFRIEYRFTAGDMLVKQAQFYLESGSDVYVFTYTDIPSRFEETKLEAEQMVSQFRIS
jgi:hypothetical protein